MQMLSAATAEEHFRVPHKTDIGATSSVVTVVVAGLAPQFVRIEVVYDVQVLSVQLVQLGFRRQEAEFLLRIKWQVVQLTILIIRFFLIHLRNFRSRHKRRF